MIRRVEPPYGNEAAMDAVQYKGFNIVVKVERELGTPNKFKVIGQIHQDPPQAPVMRNWLAVREFASEKAAYEFGLQEARAWIDEEADD